MSIIKIFFVNHDTFRIFPYGYHLWKILSKKKKKNCQAATKLGKNKPKVWFIYSSYFRLTYMRNYEAKISCCKLRKVLNNVY